RLQPLPDPFAVEHRRVGNQNELDAIQAAPPLHLGDHLDNFLELRTGGRLPVAGEGDVIEASQGRRRLAELLLREKLSAQHAIEHVFQFVAEAAEVDDTDRSGCAAIDLTVDAIEIADLIRVEVQTDADALAAPRHDGVDVEVIREGPAVIAVDEQGELTLFVVH